MKKQKELFLEGLIIGNLILTCILFWLLYSEIEYIRSELQYFSKEPISQTAVLINPITGSFVLVNVPTLFFIILVGFFILVGLYLAKKKHISGANN